MAKIATWGKISARLELSGLKLQPELSSHVIASARDEIIVNTSFNCVFVFYFFHFVFKTQQSVSHKCNKALGKI